MGIRFLCPNGHKLHVKSHLAGRKGVCPTCGVKIVIPQDSVASSAAPSVAPTQAASAPASAGWFVRGADGDQYGPAPEELFESWIEEGRIAGDTWIWREGWPEWRQASDALPGRIPPAASPAPSPPQPAPSEPAPEPEAFRPVVTGETAWPAAAADDEDAGEPAGFAIDVERADSISRLRKTHTRRQLKSSTMWAVTVLSLLAVALCGLLVWILAFRS